MLKLAAYGLISVGLVWSVGAAAAKDGPVSAALRLNYDKSKEDDQYKKNKEDDKDKKDKHSKKDECPPREDDKARSAACEKNHSRARFCRDDDEVGHCRHDHHDDDDDDDDGYRYSRNQSPWRWH